MGVSMIRAAVFDLDHTLFDRYATLRALIEHASLEELPFRPDLSRKEMADALCDCDKANVHLGWNVIRQALADRNALREDACVEGFFQTYIAPLFHREAIPFSFTYSMLNELHEMGIFVGLITNGQHELQSRKIELLGLEPYLDMIVISGDTGYHKPDRRVFDYFMSRVPFDPHEMLYIGDNPINDVDGSRKAGMIPVWVRTTGHWPTPEIPQPEYQVDTVEEIPALIRTLNQNK